MEGCAVCGAEEFIPYTCRYCWRVHCVYHRLPENHECPNIQQARAPKPVIRVQRSGISPTFRLLKVPRFSSTSGREVAALVTAWVVLGLSFSAGFFTVSADFFTLFLLMLVIVGSSFLGHELAHKFAAQKYGYWAEFRLWTQGILMALLFAVVSKAAFGGTFVFAAPGAVYIASKSGYFGEALDRKTNGIISAVGPIVNLLLGGVFIAAIIATAASGVNLTSGLDVRWFLVQGARINFWLAAFNLLPLFILDGQKVYLWDRRIWAALTIPPWALFFALPYIL